jgi:protein-tyrosine phosphatase
VRSAGTRATAGHPVSPESVSTCGRHGIDISRHRARPLDEAMARESDLVLAMERDQIRAILEMFPWTAGRVWLLGQRSGLEDPDLLGRPLQEFESFFHAAGEAFKLWLPIVRS